MLSGIPEVDLGIEAKIKNIEATEEAKQKLLDQKNRKEMPSHFVPNNIAVNFVQHNRCELMVAFVGSAAHLIADQLFQLMWSTRGRGGPRSPANRSRSTRSRRRRPRTTIIMTNSGSSSGNIN